MRPDSVAESAGIRILAVKQNQPLLHQEICDTFAWIDQELPIGAFEIWQSAMEDAHGRLEHRDITVASYIDDEGKQGKWKDLQTVIRYRCLRTIDNKTSESTRYYISSADAPAAQFAYWVRNHWSIENKLHWMLDVAFKEDKCKARTDHSPQNLNVMRKMALACLKKTPTARKTSIDRKKFIAALNPDFLHMALFGF